jgi:hypothetical protein
VNTEDQAAHIFTKSLARPLFEKTVGPISSKLMWPIIFVLCLTQFTVPVGNCEPHMEVCNILYSKSQRRTFDGPNVFSSSIRLQSLIFRRGRPCIIYITGVVFTVLNRSSVLDDTLTVSINSETQFSLQRMIHSCSTFGRPKDKIRVPQRLPSMAPRQRTRIH